MEAGVRYLLEHDPDLSLVSLSGASPPEVSAEIARVMPRVVVVDWDFPCFELLDLLAERGFDQAIRILRVHADANYVSVSELQAVRLKKASDLLGLVHATAEFEPSISLMTDEGPTLAP
jgi:hypothetical protein